MQNNVAKEYSEALFILACEGKKEKEYLDELKLTESLISENPEYMLLLSSPNVKTEEKLSVLENTFSNHLSESVMSFLLLLCEKGRITDLKLCVDDYERLYNEKCKILVARVTSSVELTEGEKEKIRIMLQKKRGVMVELICKVDKSILGGVIIETEDTVIDGSLKTKLRNVKEVMKA